MASFTEQIQQMSDKTKQEIKNIKKPLSAYQYYTKYMRERWSSLSEEERDTFMLQAKHDHQRYENETSKIQEKLKNEIKKQKIFLCQTTARVPCVGLDNGFTRYNVIGPIDNIELFTEKDKEKLLEKGVPEEYIGKYKSVGGYKFNWRAAKKWHVKVYGGNQNNNRTWWGLRENYDGQIGQFTVYTNYKDETWTENY